MSTFDPTQHPDCEFCEQAYNSLSTDQAAIYDICEGTMGHCDCKPEPGENIYARDPDFPFELKAPKPGRTKTQRRSHRLNKLIANLEKKQAINDQQWLQSGSDGDRPVSPKEKTLQRAIADLRSHLC